jgi:threonine dehydrogenase-like Zn-dependent dehydrogenase
MCRNGRYAERGIKELDGYAAEQWTVEAAYAVKLDDRLGEAGVLMEPASVVAKAWEQVDRIGARAWYEPHRVLVTGAGPIGLLAALLGHQRGLDVHVLDRVAGGPKAEAVRGLGGTYHHDPVDEVAEKLRPDVVIEATGASAVVIETVANTASYGITCLTGVSTPGRPVTLDIGAANREIVLDNNAIVGSVNANLRHYRAAAAALADADQRWLSGLITRRVPLTRFADALAGRPDDIKVVIALAESP